MAVPIVAGIAMVAAGIGKAAAATANAVATGVKATTAAAGKVVGAVGKTAGTTAKATAQTTAKTTATAGKTMGSGVKSMSAGGSKAGMTKTAVPTGPKSALQKAPTVQGKPGSSNGFKQAKQVSNQNTPQQDERPGIVDTMAEYIQAATEAKQAPEGVVPMSKNAQKGPAPAPVSTGIVPQQKMGMRPGMGA